jgi:hypothetical protein
MKLNISYAQKDAAKTAFRNAGLPLTWNAATKTWQTSATELPASLAHYAPAANPQTAAQEGPAFYLAQRTCASKGFDFTVEAVFASKEAVIDAITSGRFLAGWAGSEASILVNALYVVAANRRISVGKAIPNQYVTGHNRLIDSKNMSVQAALAQYR